jgi:hypothetical protein
LETWPEIDAHLAFSDEEVLAGKPDWVKAHRCDDGSIFSLWGSAISHCNGDYIAILSPYLIPENGWLEAMVDAASGGERACFGPVEEAYSPTQSDIIGYLIEYCHFHRPFVGDHGEIPGTNLLVRSSELPPCDILREEGFTKTDLLRSWVKESYLPAYVNDAVVIHQRPYDGKPYRSRRFYHGRAYGASSRQGMTFGGLVLSLAKSVLLPFVRVWRIWARVRHVGRLRRAVRSHILAVLLAETAWSVGEFIGLATGNPGDPCGLD